MRIAIPTGVMLSGYTERREGRQAAAATGRTQESVSVVNWSLARSVVLVQFLFCQRVVC